MTSKSGREIVSWMIRKGDLYLGWCGEWTRKADAPRYKKHATVVTDRRIHGGRIVAIVKGKKKSLSIALTKEEMVYMRSVMESLKEEIYSVRMDNSLLTAHRDSLLWDKDMLKASLARMTPIPSNDDEKDRQIAFWKWLAVDAQRKLEEKKSVYGRTNGLHYDYHAMDDE